MRVVEFLPVARAEADDAYDWYLLRGGERQALRFLCVLEAAAARIARFPRQERHYVHGTRRIVLRPYRYLLVYREIGDLIQIVAVAHGSRRRGYWVDRL